jgi:hypothetical protein
MTQFGEIDIQVFFEIGVRQEFENFGALEFSVALADWALQDVIVFSHCVFLSEPLEFRGCRLDRPPRTDYSRQSWE